MENRITEQASAYDDLQRMSVHDILTGINREDARVHEAVRTTIPVMERLVERIVERMQRGGRMFYIGAGTSGRLAVTDASELPPLRTRRWKKVLPPEEAERRAGDDAEYESQYPEEEIVIDPQIDEEAPEFKDPYVNGDEDELDTSGWPTQPVISS